ncbi:MAG: radical SAM protein [Elusimicrobium sp.]|uniref:Radical SAM protein n=1 Tax=Candidatus Avelusimicrobium gallicola TaxID=2562704 RepID=A0A928HEF7_9BACT|nr:radical SAM protein [Elusimicrobium sp.]
MENNQPAKIIYRFGDGVYINLTNRCPNLCAFCIKTKWQMDFHGNNLNLQGNEPSPTQVVAALDEELKKAPFKEVVFCGYGEPTMRLDALLFTAQMLKGWKAQCKYPPFTVRVNTNGLGNLINHKDIVPELAKLVDDINISLNAQNEETWQKIVRPAEGYEHGFEAVREFIRSCAQAGFRKVLASCVDQTGADNQAVQKIAEEDGATFYLRSFLDAQN